MAPTVIRAEGLSKRYALGQRERYGALRDVLANAFTASSRRSSANGRSARDADAASACIILEQFLRSLP